MGMNFNGVTVREMLQLPIMRDALLISGEKGLDRIVRYIDIMEVPDIQGWLREGEMILTTGYSMRHDPSLFPKLVEHLARVGAAGVAVKPERFIAGIPQEMIDKGNEYDIPVIQLPVGIPYIDITHSIMERILDKQAVILRRSEEVYKTLTNLVLNNSGLQVVADNVAELLQSPIRVLDRSGEVLISSPRDAVNETAARELRWNIIVDNQVVGELVVARERLDELELVCVEQARLVFSLEIMRRKIAHDTETRLRGSFFEELLMGLPLTLQEIETRGRQLGLLPEWSWEIAMIEGEASHLEEQAPFMQKLQELILQQSGNRKTRSHVIRQGERIILILSGHGTSSKDWTSVLSRFVRSWSQIRIGFGTVTPLKDIQRSCIEAKKALLIGTRLNRERTIHIYKELELFSLLLDCSEYVTFDSLVDSHIGKLTAYDQENGTDLLTTLYYYLESGGSLIETANRLYIHRNSVKYRMDRIKEIADIDVDNMQKRFTYYFCTTFHLLKNQG
ncbi:PucR family transcriptional regulator [Paenibacillus sp. NPDC056579]|uniref:PucR family transcriptional regulator n=1 Tax=Paenibacillus sp. NPDC056579 TaxID=3345871 RepID=UPI0036754062